MAKLFRKRKLRFFSIAVFLVVFSVVFLNFGTKTFAATQILGTTPDGTGQLIFDNATNKYSITGQSGNPTITQAVILGGKTYYVGSNNKGYVVTNGLLYAYDESNFNNIVQGYTGLPASFLNAPNIVTGKTFGAPLQEQPNDGQCLRGLTDAGSFIDIGNCLAQLAYFFLWLASYIVGFVGWVFNAVFDFTVRNITDTVGKIPVIEIGWKLVRDLANISFIFILLYLAIATILRLDQSGVQKSLSRLVIAAVLVNFSLMFTKVIIDVPNMLAINIYDKILITGEGGTSPGRGKLGDAFMTIFAPATIVGDEGLGQNKLAEQGSSVQLNADNAQIFAASQSPFTSFAMGIILNFFVIIVFLAVIIIFIKRFVVLVFLMIFSPLAFAGMASPVGALQSAAKEKFWMTLVKESFYAPIFMICVFLTLRMGQGLMENQQLIGVEDYGRLNIGLIISYIVTIVMLVASLFIAEMMGVRGASSAMAGFKGMAAWGGRVAWRNTGGSLAYNLIEKTRLGTEGIKQMRQGMLFGKRVPWIARGLVKAMGNGLTTGLGKAGEGHHEDIERDKKALKDTLHELRNDPAKQADFIAKTMAGGAILSKLTGELIQPYDKKVAKYVAEEMKDDEVANTVAFMRDRGKTKEADTLMDYLGKSREANVNNIIKNKALDFHRVKADELLGRDFDGKDTKKGDPAEFLNFASGLNARQLSNVLGGISKPQLDSLDPNQKHSLQMVMNGVTDANVFEQMQRDATMIEGVRNMASTAQHAAKGREIAVTKMNDVIAGITTMSQTEAQAIIQMFEGAKGMNQALIEMSRVAAATGSLTQATSGADLQKIVASYNAEQKDIDTPLLKYAGGNGQRWYKKTQDVRGWETDLGGATITP